MHLESWVWDNQSCRIGNSSLPRPWFLPRWHIHTYGLLRMQYLLESSNPYTPRQFIFEEMD